MLSTHLENTRQDLPLRIGTPCIWGDMANPDRTGWIAEIGTESEGFVIAGNGMESAGAKLTIVWEDNTLSTVSTAIAQSWLDRAERQGLLVINDAPERLKEAQAAQVIAHDKAQQDRDRAAQERSFWDDAHREKYSMGAGYYLSEGSRYRTGWRVRKISLYDADPIRSVPMGDWCVPDDAKPSPKTGAKSASAATGGVTIEEHTHTKKGFQMWIVCLADRVERSNYDALLAQAKESGGWYSRAWKGTPAGFAFKDQTKAEQFADSIGSPSPNDGGPSRAPASTGDKNAVTAEKLRSLADKLQSDIDAKRAPRAENTPKRQRQAGDARNDATHLERTQSGLRALADLQEAGTVPGTLEHVTTKKAALELACSKIDHSGGYYDSGRDLNKPALDTNAARAFWDLLGAPDPAKIKADAIARASADVSNRKIAGYFPTPAPVVDRMLDHAQIDPDMTILEPSAGSGAILDGIKALAPSADLTACEVSPRLREILELKGYALAGHDFTDWQPDSPFDRVLMNPPFENGQDMDHVRRAFDMLKPGGRLVAIMSPGYSFRSDKRAVAFRDWLAGLVWEFEELPAGAFKESGTGVQTHMLIIEAEA